MSPEYTKTPLEDQTTSSAVKAPTCNPEQVRSGFPFAKAKLISFDGAYEAETRLYLPDRLRFYGEKWIEGAAVARGAGLSYSPASIGFSSQCASIDQRYFNRIISFDPKEKLIEVETGMSLGDLYEFLAPRQLLLATQPGHPKITIGGCIGADIHGKNQYLDGTFMDQVEELVLFHPDHGKLRLNRKDNYDLFRLSCGGYGLTGVILSAKLRLKAVPSMHAIIKHHLAEDIASLPSKLQELAGTCDFLYSWHDFMAKGKDFGRGFITTGKFTTTGDGDKIGEIPDFRASKFSADKRASFPAALMNPLSTTFLNMYYRQKLLSQKEQSMTLFESLYPIFGQKELYFSLFGRPGFIEYQCVIPLNRFAEYIDGIKSFAARRPVAFTLASAKLFSGKQDLLRFTGEGVCFILDFPRDATAAELLPYMDSLLLKCGGIPNIIKDSRLPKSVVASAYPEYEKFRQQLRAFDPKQRFRSEISQRLEL